MLDSEEQGSVTLFGVVGLNVPKLRRVDSLITQLSYHLVGYSPFSCCLSPSTVVHRTVAAFDDCWVAVIPAQHFEARWSLLIALVSTKGLVFFLRIFGDDQTTWFPTKQWRWW